MWIVRALFERSLRLALLLSRIALLSMGLAILAGSLGIGAFVRQQETSHLAGFAVGWIQSVGVLSLAAGVLLFVVHNFMVLPRPADPAAPSGPPGWLSLVAVTLLAQAVAAWFLSLPLAAFWKEIIPALERTGVFRDLQRSDSMTGWMLVPLIAVLFVPLIEAASALWLILGPLLLVALFLLRSRFFPKLLVMTAITQAAVVGASVLASHAFNLLAMRFLLLEKPGDPVEARAIFAGMRMIQDVGWATARAHALLLPATLIWLPAMMRSRRLWNVFEERARDTSGEAPLAPASR